MTAIIRAYQTKDKESVIHCMKSNVPAHFAVSEIDDLIYYLENEIEDYFVLEYHGEIKAASGINYEPKRGKLSWDFVDADAQGKGFGSKLLNHRLSILRNNTAIDLITVRTSQTAFQFYEKHDFVVQRIVKNYWADGFDLYEMTYQPKPTTQL
ncbi:GNAT family N-acetyltransferase [Sphingobacterium hungaricum]